MKKGLKKERKPSRFALWKRQKLQSVFTKEDFFRFEAENIDFSSIDSSKFVSVNSQDRKSASKKEISPKKRMKKNIQVYIYT